MDSGLVNVNSTLDYEKYDQFTSVLLKLYPVVPHTRHFYSIQLELINTEYMHCVFYFPVSSRVSCFMVNSHVEYSIRL